nr:hypothetical protein [Candidatus Dormibacteraeota bacterium]
LAASVAFHLGAGAPLSAVPLAVAALTGALVPSAALRRTGFPILALLSGLAAVSWLAGVAGTTVA